jgi:hypothetical protein
MGNKWNARPTNVEKLQTKEAQQVVAINTTTIIENKVLMRLS